MNNDNLYVRNDITYFFRNRKVFYFRFNLSQRQIDCDSSVWNVYHTLVENDKCEPLQFLPENLSIKRIALLSCPGSGNTWTRHLIEQASGIYSGSYFSDFRLDRSGNYK